MNLERISNHSTAICGEINVGKTTLINELKKMGYKTLILDDYVNYLYQNNNDLINEFKNKIGNFILENNKISKELLKKYILDDFNNIYKLEEIIYPYISNHLINNKYDFVEIPVLESKKIDFSGFFKYVVVVHKKTKFLVENQLINWLNNKNNYIIDRKRKNTNLKFVDIYNDNHDISKKIKKILVKTQ
ncbi:dephospho-CoA kinase [Mycoplasma sp. OR1901]|uniref:dephospho-CoA kinase n=1 Tax=Mycoplasma sp. OR1901 TaxID=2742195 RepID=UPI001581E4E7|nr:dephospho-CoA kinase [Mycoplasma sp. OR1901]QKT05307.1 dephospho-CoA kinase [Mycoplasma sp. OR1901]